MFDNHGYLYVDDEDLSREVMQLVMKAALHVKNLTVFQDSEDFISRIEDVVPAPDVFLLDIHVTPLDGFQMLRLLREHPDFKESRIIAVTASVMSEEVTRLREAGFDGAVAKPVRVSTFPDVLARILRGESVWSVGT